MTARAAGQPTACASNMSREPAPISRRAAQGDNIGIAETDEESRASANERFLAQQEDSVELILWYHGQAQANNNMRPVYSLDARLLNKAAPTPVNSQLLGVGNNQLQQQAVNSSQDSFVPVVLAPQLNYNGSNEDARQARFLEAALSKEAKHFALAKRSARLKMRITQAKAYLIIDKVEASDAGHYKCRVDYKFARTRYQLTRLQVISKTALPASCQPLLVLPSKFLLTR